MSLSKPNASAATLTRNRVTPSPVSGLCVTCLEGCPGLCEVGKSAFRGTEVIYPAPFGTVTAGAEKDYPVDYSHIQVMGTCVGAHGLPADSDKALFTRVRLEQTLGAGGGIKLRLPISIPALGSTEIARVHWDGLASGAALAGVLLAIGENVVGMDESAKVNGGSIEHAQELRRRVELYRRWQRDGFGGIVVQANVEDTRLGVQEYALAELGAQIVELQWGQGAKDIGGEVKIPNLAKAQMLKQRGYIVLPDPTDPMVIQAFEHRAFREFERHSRIGMVTEEGFVSRVKQLRDAGAKHIFLKTGAYRPADLARALKYCSEAKVDVLTVDGAGGGTGMSPWRMMNEWGVPTLELESLTHRYAKRLAEAGKHLPDIIIAGGFSLEDHVFKALAMGAPYVKAVGMARAPMTAAMVGRTLGLMIAEDRVPNTLKNYGTQLEEIFILASELKSELGKDFKDLPPGGLGLYSYLQRLAQGLRQLMCGSRKFAVGLVSRDDVCALTREAAHITGLPYLMDVDAKQVDDILGC
jgi:glutamate synthase domain-containing protein 2